ncbi:MAG: DUF3823 domain-containing protein [Bacteroidales bacterium]|nr:DUF3823 domain-containing protein [Bacteroidales bacterium]
MKSRVYFYLLLIIISITSCSIDNYDMPNATLSGRVLDNVTNEMVQNGGVNSGTIIQLFEGKYKQPILSYSYPDGHFTNEALFAGNYKLFAVGAFKLVGDTMRITINKDTEVDIKVLPNVRLKATLQSFVGTTATVKVEYSKVHSDQVLNQLAVVWSTIDYPNLYTFSGGGQKTETVTSQNLTEGEMIFTITGLTAGKKYYFRAAGRTNAPGNYYNYSATVVSQ